MSLLFYFSNHTEVRNKQPLKGFAALQKNWRSMDGTIADLQDTVARGWAWMPAILKRKATRAKANVVGCESIALDIDAGMTIDDALADEFVRTTAALIYTSSSHQKAKDNAPACDRFRIVWLLPSRVSVPTYEALYGELLRRYPCADKSTSDASRLWYGNTAAIFPLVNGSAILPWDMVLDAEAKSETIAAQIAEQRARSAERFANSDPDDLRSQVRDALALIPPRNPGSGNYHECLRVAFAVGAAFPEDEALELIEEWSPRIAGAWQPENIVGKGNGSITIGSLFAIAKQYGYRLPSKDPIATFGAKARTITRDEWVERFGQSELCERLNRAVRRSSAVLDFLKEKRAETVAKHSPIAIEPNTTQTAIELYDRRNDGRLAWELSPGQIPTMQEWIDRGRPTLTFTNIDDRSDWWISLAESGEFDGVIASDDTGMGKSDSAGKVGAIVASGSTKFGRAIYASGDHRNPSTESVEQALDMPTRHNGLTIDRTRHTPSGNPFVVRPKAGQQTDITANCSKADVFAKAQSLGHTLRGGAKSPYCQSCEHFSSCSSSGFIALRSIATSPEYGAKFLRADLSQIQKYRDTDLVMVEEADASIAATKSLSITAPQLALEMQALELATVSRDDITASDAMYAQTVARAVRDSLLSLLATTQPEYGFTHAEVVKALPTRDTLTELLFEAQWTHWVNASSPFDVPSVDEVARVINRILTPDFDRLFGAGESVETHLNRLDSLTPNGIGKVLGVILGDRFTDLSLNGQLVITRRDHRAANSIPSAGFAVLMTATSGDRRRLCKLAGLDPDRVPSIRVQKPDYSNLTIQIIQGVGSCGRKRRDQSTFDAGKRITYLLDHLKPEASIDYMGKADRYWFRDNRGSNEFKSMSHIAAVGLPTPNLGAAAAEWHALTGYAVNPTDRTGGYGSFVRRLIAAELLQFIGRPRSQWRPDEQITVTLIGDGFVAYQRQIAEQFPGASIKVVDAIDVLPIAATKGEQSARAIINNIVSFARNGETITRQSIAAETGHSNPSKAIKDRLGVSLTELKQAVTFVLEALNTKVTVDWDSIPEQLRALLQECFSLADTLATEDPDAAAQIILEAIETARAEFGDTLTLASLAYFPIAHFEPLLKALDRIDSGLAIA
jgi:hypothetical protein